MYEKGTKLPCPLQDMPFSLYFHVFNNPEALLTPCFWDLYGGLIM